MSPQILPRFNAAMNAIEDERKVARAVLESVDTSSTSISKATAPGDNRRLRGIPCVSRGVAGVSPGTDPLAAVIRRYP